MGGFWDVVRLTVADLMGQGVRSCCEQERFRRATSASYAGYNCAVPGGLKAGKQMDSRAVRLDWHLPYCGPRPSHHRAYFGGAIVKTESGAETIPTRT